VVEVKPQKFVAKHIEKLRAAEALIKRRGAEFVVCTDQDISKDARGERADEILRHARSLIAQNEVHQLVTSVRNLNLPMSAEAIAERLGVNLERVVYLIGRRHLSLEATLSLDVVHHKNLEGDDSGRLSTRAWFGGADW
jgi:hypothetical protein